MWEWLLQNVLGGSRHSKYSLPVLDKPAAPEQQQQQHGQQQQPEYCLRMAFKLTPAYSSQLQVQFVQTLWPPKPLCSPSCTPPCHQQHTSLTQLQNCLLLLLHGAAACCCCCPWTHPQLTQQTTNQARVRWLNVLQAAQQPAGGSWTLDFDADGEWTEHRGHYCACSRTLCFCLFCRACCCFALLLKRVGAHTHED